MRFANLNEGIQALISAYSNYLKEVKEGRIPNSNIPPIAQTYWNLAQDARLSDLIKVVREDEDKHRQSNHHFANDLKRKIIH